MQFTLFRFDRRMCRISSSEKTTRALPGNYSGNFASLATSFKVNFCHCALAIIESFFFPSRLGVSNFGDSWEIHARARKWAPARRRVARVHYAQVAKITVATTRSFRKISFYSKYSGRFTVSSL